MSESLEKLHKVLGYKEVVIPGRNGGDLTVGAYWDEPRGEWAIYIIRSNSTDRFRLNTLGIRTMDWVKSQSDVEAERLEQRIKELESK